jgi:acyl carrier protein
MSQPLDSLNRETILHGLIGLLENMTSDWDTDFEGGITADTRLIGDLGFESIDVVQLVVAIEEHYQRRNLPLERLLMEDGHYVDELKVGKIADFLAEHLNGSPETAQG